MFFGTDFAVLDLHGFNNSGYANGNSATSD
jgi:hypothetical protein